METKKKPNLGRIYEYVLQFHDVRAVGLLLFLVVVLLITWSSVKVIDTNYRLQKEISRLEQETTILQLTNTNARLENTYLETNQYLEIAARQNFGLAAPGETVLNIPGHVALRHTVDLPAPEEEQVRSTKSKQPAYQRNFQAWMNFFLHRPISSD